MKGKITVATTTEYEGDFVMIVALRQRKLVQEVDDKGMPVGEPITEQAPWATVGTSEVPKINTRELTDKEYGDLVPLALSILEGKTVEITEVEASTTTTLAASADPKGGGL